MTISRRLRLFWNRWRWLLCEVGIHRWEGLYAPGRGSLGGGKYLWVETCLWCQRER